MSTPRGETAALALDLATSAVPCLDHVPEAIEPPLIILQPADPYLDANATTFGEFSLNLEAWLTVELIDNETAADELDTLLDHLLGHLPEPWGIDQVGQPGPIHTADWLAHGIRVTVSRYITL